MERPMSRTERFFTELREAQDALLESSSAVGELRDRMPLVVSRRKWRVRWALAVAAALAVLLPGAFLILRGERSLDFALGEGQERGEVGAWIAAPGQERLRIGFSDGTRIDLEANTRARVQTVSPQGAHLVIERGRATADVVHRPEARWLVDVGPFKVNVVGTRFDLGWDPTKERLDLALHSGAVIVSGAFLRHPINVGQGQRLVVSNPDRHVELTDKARVEAVASQKESSRSERSAEIAGASSAEATRPPPSARGLTATPRDATWQELAASGKYKDAHATVDRLGFEAECKRASGDELVTLGDVARFAGDAVRARRAYIGARTKLKQGGRSAFGLGLVAFDQERNFADAARWFRTYLAEQPRGALRREALGRLMEALSRSGDAADAREVAGQYLSSYPDGSHAALARELLAR
jgi:transmembrane sensor